MKESFRASMAWLHTWVGLIPGWLLFAVFLTGTLSYLRPEMTQWMEPEVRPADVSVADAARHVVSRLQEVAPGSRNWMIDLPDGRKITATAFYTDPDDQGFRRDTLSPETGEPVAARSTRGGEVLFYFHFDLLMPSLWGRLIVGIAAVAMLVGILTGIVTHRRIFRDFFTFRPGKGQRSWLDAHNVVGVLALPYHLVITYTGIVTLIVLYMPWGFLDRYEGSRLAFLEDAEIITPQPSPSGTPAELADIGAMTEAVQDLWQGNPPRRIVIALPGDAHAQALFYPADNRGVAYRERWALFDAASGQLLRESRPKGAASHTYSVLYGLHLGRFSDPVLRLIFLAWGAMGTAMVGTGLLLWVRKRQSKLERNQPMPRGMRIAEHLNVGVIAGLPVGIAALFLANRLLPLDLAARDEQEVLVFLLAWLIVALANALRPIRRAWIETLALCALGYAAIPIVNALTTDRGLLPSLKAGDVVFAGFDLTCIAASLLFAWLSWYLAHRPAPVTRQRKAPSQQASMQGVGE